LISYTFLEKIDSRRKNFSPPKRAAAGRSVKIRSPDFRQKKFACLPQAGILIKRHRQITKFEPK
jgi:hypothetical protein